MDFGMNVVTSWDSSTYDPNSFEEQTIYGEVNRAELEKYFTISENADLRAVRKVQLQPDPTEPEITQLPVFRWKNGDFTLPDNTIFTWRRLQVKPYNDEVGTLVGGVAKVKGTDTVAPGTFSFKNTPPFYLRTLGEHDVTVVFTPDDLRLHKPTEITIKINAIKNTISNIDEPDPITDKPFGTPFAELGLPENVCINAVDGAWRWINVAWDESSYDAESVDWQTIIGTPVLSEDDGDVFQQPEPAVTAAIRVKLIDNRPPMPPTIVAESLPDGMEGEAYSNRLTAKGTAPITWSIVSGALPEGLSLNEDTGEISGTPAGEGTEVFTVMAVNDLGEDIKEFSITIAKAPETEYAVTVRDDGHGTGSADPASATAGTEITLTATPNAGYHFKEWQVMSGDVTVRDDKFTMPGSDVEVKAIFEEDAPPTPTEYTVTFDGNGGTPSVGSMTTTDQKLTSLPSASRSGSYSFDGWYTEKSGGTKITTDTVFSANTTVYAHWTHTGDNNPPVNYYTLRFETGGGSDIPSVRESYNTYIDLTKYVPTWRGHTFIGWYSERSLTNKVSGVYLTKDMTVYAGWRVDENPNTGANPFTDVSEKDWFYGDVMFVYENGLMLGTSKTLFSPHGTATRGMMATILWRMEGSPAPKGKNSFTDVEAGKWYADAITWTAENGIFAGYGKDKFGPDDPITREQLAAIFYRYADYKGYDLTVKGNLDKFKDADKITDYAKTAMQWAVGSGLVKGKSGNLLDPQGTATRAEIAAMLHRFIEKYELVQGKAPGGLMGWIDPKRLQIPKTGDSSVLGLWGFSLCASLAGCLVLTTWQIRRRREEKSLQSIEK